MNSDQVLDKAAKLRIVMAQADKFSPTPDVIAVLAYKLWTERGNLLGSPEEDWFRAKHQIEHDRTPGCVL